MQTRVKLVLGAAMATVMLAASGSFVAAAQTGGASYTAPKTAFGAPDLQGYWHNTTLTPITRRPDMGDRLVYTEEEAAALERQVEIEVEEGNQPTDPNASATYVAPSSVTRPEFQAAGGAVGGYNRFWLDPGNRVMRVGGEPRTSLITTPNGRPPARKANAVVPPRGIPPVGSFSDPETRSLGERCIIGFGRNGGPPMLHNGFYNNNYHIVQSPNAVMIEVEMNHDARIIRLNSKHRTDDVRPYFGDSIGWYEGDTLVVETTHLPEQQAFMGSWKNLKVTERFKRVAEDRLYYAFTVEDADIWDAPWGGEYEFAPMDGQIYEYACHEGNYALPGILAGGRVEERRAAQK